MSRKYYQNIEDAQRDLQRMITNGARFKRMPTLKRGRYGLFWSEASSKPKKDSPRKDFPNW